MSLTLEALNKRVEELEREVAGLRALVIPSMRPAASEGRAAESATPMLGHHFKKMLEGMGITSPPSMTIEELHRAMIDGGVKPEDNAASREIIAMREE